MVGSCFHALLRCRRRTRRAFRRSAGISLFRREVLKEDESGSLKATIEDILFKAKRKRYGAAPQPWSCRCCARCPLRRSEPGGVGLLQKPAESFCRGRRFCVTLPGEQLDQKPGLALLQITSKQPVSCEIVKTNLLARTVFSSLGLLPFV